MGSGTFPSFPLDCTRVYLLCLKRGTEEVRTALCIGVCLRSMLGKRCWDVCSLHFPNKRGTAAKSPSDLNEEYGNASIIPSRN